MPAYTYNLNIDQYRRIASVIRRYYGNRAVVIFEVGSRDAADAFLLGTLLPKGSRLVCFDPHPKFKDLAAPFAACGSVFIENIAISETSGSRSFYMTDTADVAEACDDLGIGASSLKKPFANVAGLPTTGFQEVIVTCERGDVYCTRHRMIPDAIIMDVQGAEIEVLKSFGAELDSVGLVFTECNIRSNITYHDDAAANEIVGYLQNRCFNLLESYNVSRYSADLVFLNAARHSASVFKKVSARTKLFAIAALKQALAKALGH